MNYSAGYGIWKSIKDLAAVAVAAGIAIVGTNAAGIANQCPDATVTILGTTIALKAIMQFVNNWRKNKDN